MEQELILRTALDISILILGIIVIFWKGYFRAKAKNIATKEDIGDITREIENVKNELSFNNLRNRDWYVENKNNYLNCYDSYFSWIESFRVADVVLIYHDDLKSLRDATNSLKKANREFLKYLWRIRLYETDLEFVKSVFMIYSDTVKSHNHVQNLLLLLEDITASHLKLVEKAKLEIGEIEDIKLEFDGLKKSKKNAFSEYENQKEEFKLKLDSSRTEFIKLFRKKINMDYTNLN